MVLDEAVASSPPGEADAFGLSAADGDGGDSSSKQYPEQIVIDLASLPKPVPILGRLTGFTPKRTIETIATMQQGASMVLQRPLTQEEGSALAHEVASAVSIHSYGQAVGGLLGLARCYQTTAQFKFPLLRPKFSRINTDRFGRFGGARARLAWHIIRYSLYFALSTTIGSFAFNVYSVNRAGYRITRNPALKELSAAGDRVRVVREQLARNSRPRPPQSPQRDSHAGAEESAESPETAESAESAAGYDTSPLASSSPSRARAGATAAADDSTTSGSSWDRIRRQGGDNNSTADYSASSAAGRADGSTSQDSFGFSSADEDSPFAKDEAQRDFDRHVQMEREGKGFSESSRRW